MVTLERFLARLHNTKWAEIQVGEQRWAGTYITADFLLGNFKRGTEGLNKLHSHCEGSSKSERSMLLDTEKPHKPAAYLCKVNDFKLQDFLCLAKLVAEILIGGFYFQRCSDQLQDFNALRLKVSYLYNGIVLTE